MILMRLVMGCILLVVPMAWVLDSPLVVKYDHVALGKEDLVEIYFSSDKDDLGGAYNIACALSRKTKYPNVFPEEGVAIYGKVTGGMGSGRFKAKVFMDGFSRSGQYVVGKFDIERELNGGVNIPCTIYRRGFSLFKSETAIIEVPVKDLYSALEW